MLTYATWQEPTTNFEVDESYKGALEVLRWSYAQYGDEIVYACSFGIEGIVLIDLISKVKPNATIVFLDTDVHFKETYDTIERVKANYPQLTIILQKPKLTLEEQKTQYGDELWKSNPNQCCDIRKIKPLHEALSGAKAWISGLRREQSPTRQQTNFINRDEKFKSIKICPLIHWSWKDIWRYVSKHNLTYNPLHDQGYPSIGCEHCTQPAFTLDDLRAGRWQGTGKTECGLHE
ncbi:phosphoadenosine phosphosulfate reductase [Lysinibacillus sphaericus]|uniref:Adenosine 5'-phosphosulfate reductase n=1 Tax=Lysinibacillus sphaericus TaxID=1421 RepID=A0A2S5CWL9_LYSSH|nr:phosphoadenylyl-sulfate reductase [Lysinibacillus sphaericus]OEC02977.1 phosphoadenosine phosphosulfate reductase [Lysinibacillus sphaericus]POZ55190.1 Phosphoadenosine phosphosulfate reductase [Lysinibacillus sphaericus]